MKTFAFIIAMLFFSGCSEKIVTGEVIGSGDLSPSKTQRIIFGVPSGTMFMIKNGNDFVGIIAQKNTFKSGDSVKIVTDELVFKGTFLNEYKQANDKMRVYSIKSYEILSKN